MDFYTHDKFNKQNSFTIEIVKWYLVVNYTAVVLENKNLIDDNSYEGDKTYVEHVIFIEINC